MRLLLPILIGLFFRLYHALPTADTQLSANHGDGLNGVPVLTDEKRAARDAIARPADTDHLLARDDVNESRWQSLPTYGERYSEMEHLNQLLDQRWSPHSTPELLKATDYEVAQLFSLAAGRAQDLVCKRLGNLRAKYVNIGAVSKDVNLMSDLSACEEFQNGFDRPQEGVLFNELALLNTPEKLYDFLSVSRRVQVVYANSETNEILLQKKIDRLSSLGEPAEMYHDGVRVDIHFSDPIMQELHDAKVRRLALTRHQIFEAGIKNTDVAQQAMKDRRVTYIQVLDWYNARGFDMSGVEHRYAHVLDEVNNFFVHKAEAIAQEFRSMLPTFEDVTKGLLEYGEAMTHEDSLSDRGGSVPMSPTESASGESVTSSHSIAQKWQTDVARWRGNFRA